MFRRCVLVAVTLVAGVLHARSGLLASGRPPALTAQLEGSALICSSEAVAAAGFQVDPTTRKASPLAEGASEKKASASIIRLVGNEADVLPVTGAKQAPGPVGRFAAHKAGNAMALWQRDGLTLRTMTIDLQNGSFVYSQQEVDETANRVRVFSGSCRPYV